MVLIEKYDFFTHEFEYILVANYLMIIYVDLFEKIVKKNFSFINFYFILNLLFNLHF